MARLDGKVAERLQQMFGLSRVPATTQELGRLWAERGPVSTRSLFAPAPTPHRVRWSGGEGWTNCVLDALILAFLSDEPVEVETVSPLERATIRLRLSPEELASSHPEAVISLGVSGCSSGAVTQVCCPHILAFVDLEEYNRWQASQPDVLSSPLSLVEAWHLAADIAEGPDHTADWTCPCCAG